MATQIQIRRFGFLDNVDFPNTGQGILPDYPYEVGLDEVLQKKDGMMDFALELIRKKKN